ncbi:hypothetical protein Vadar_015288 [Vaccinium darrowii]|uniref:Uncharacterized protein n=1 Tax=Vaccinium darrowii TaxID=229202 RepID=A0ACB7XAZ9_9ERIC|nr:hypothetical protein Vadar_015288 [Vaccinium darrowii]
MINAYGMHGRGKAAVDLFKQMEDESLVPDHVTFLALLYACSHSGLVDEGRKFYEAMKNEYQLEPWPEHCTCLVDLLGRANHLEEAFQIVERMQTEPTAAIWRALLGACQTHSNKSLGEIAAQKLLELDPENPRNYVLTSNILAAKGRWDDVADIRMRMKEKQLKKDPACSWIEVGNKVHTFIARDRSHPQSYEIYEKLGQIIDILETEGGYVAQTEFVLHDVEEKEKVKMLHGHSERLAMAYALISTPEGTPIRITKNLRVCGDCHTFTTVRRHLATASSGGLGRPALGRPALGRPEMEFWVHRMGFDGFRSGDPCLGCPPALSLKAGKSEKAKTTRINGEGTVELIICFIEAINAGSKKQLANPTKKSKKD